MGKIKHLRITLNKPPNQAYVCGETLSGTVHLTITERLRIKCFKLVLTGKSHVQWDDWVIIGRAKRTIVYADNDVHMRLKTELLDSGGNEDLHLEPKEYSFPFKFTLDEDLPSSFEHKHARVRYSIRAVADIPWAMNMYTAISFTLINLYDLNTLPQHVRSPFALSESKQVGFVCCKQPVTLNFSIPKCAFVPGERIHFTAEIDNRSGSKLKDIRVNLTQMIKIFVKEKTKTYKRKLGFMSMHKHVSGSSFEKWESNYRIPATCPTLDTSRILEITYLFHLTVDSGKGSSVEVNIPIYIGTIPVFENIPPAVKQSNKQKPANIGLSMISLRDDDFFVFEAGSGGNTSNDLPPPYDEGGEAIETDIDQYKPCYVYFKDLNKVNNGDYWRLLQ